MKTSTKTFIVLLTIMFLIVMAIQEKAQTTNSEEARLFQMQCRRRAGFQIL